jgi:opacity protein-like surface antigen
MLRHKCFSLLVVTACMLGSKAFAADAAVSANGFQEQAAEGPRFELETESEATTRGNWGVFVQGTGALKGSLDESGVRTRIGFGYSGYNYPLTGSELIGAQLPNGLDQIGQIGKITGYEPGVDILLGYQWVTERWSLMGFLGAAYLHDSLSYPDPTNKVQGTAWGFKTVWELDAHPTDQTMFYTYASFTTAFDTAHIDMRPGYLLFNNVAIGDHLSVGKIYLGPQGVFSSDIHDRVWKVGAHLTLDEIGPLQVTLASGYVHDRFLGPGAYFMLDTSVRF